jgi:UDP-N-acetylmuramyl pentapeptide phosphotransferase/UDP-N-acetylglucosamine-1-phosphate transferase
MSLLVVSFLSSLVVALLLIRSAGQHSRHSADHDFAGPQKFHTRAVPRIGGVAVFLGVLAGALLGQINGEREIGSLWLLILSSLPTFTFGLAEDLTKSISERRRLFFTAVSAGLAIWLLGGVIHRTAIPGIDSLITMYPFAIALTVFAVTGVSNSVNIIDGFNGLASMCVLIMVASIAYIGFQLGDRFIIVSALVTIGAALGFFIWNFPAGLIFLGDGGAYFLGFVLSELCVLLLVRNASVSPMFPLLLCAYPIFETVFTMYRRKFVKGVSTAAPDGIHLHTLIHRRVLRLGVGVNLERRQMARNSMTSPYLWVLCLMSVIPSVLWWNNTGILTGFLFMFIGSYVALYWSIVRFKTPKWLVFRQ